LILGIGTYLRVKLRVYSDLPAEHASADFTGVVENRRQPSASQEQIPKVWANSTIRVNRGGSAARVRGAGLLRNKLAVFSAIFAKVIDNGSNACCTRWIGIKNIYIIVCIYVHNTCERARPVRSFPPSSPTRVSLILFPRPAHPTNVLHALGWHLVFLHVFSYTVRLVKFCSRRETGRVHGRGRFVSPWTSNPTST
jgi:hypothetical protein